MANDFEERSALLASERMARQAEALRIYQRLVGYGVTFAMFTFPETLFLLSIFKHGGIEPTTEHDIKLLQGIEREFFVGKVR